MIPDQESTLKKQEFLYINSKQTEIVTRTVNGKDYFVIYKSPQDILVLDQEEYNIFLIENKVYG